MQTLSEVRAAIAADPLLRTLAERVAPRLGDDPGHDLEHALRVALWTVRIGERAQEKVDRREAIAAALLHDAVNLAKDDPRRAEASALSGALALRWLTDLGVDDQSAARIAAAVRTHSFSRGEVPESALGDALQDADRLEALGVLGVFRTISTGTRMGGRYFDPGDPWAKRRALDDRRNAIDHFFVKLLGLPATMRTAVGRAEGLRRAGFMEVMLGQLGEELGVPYPGPGLSSETDPESGDV